ncbi:alpha-amylase family glycosyl hydrolase [Caldanaerobacter subterraneus]|uniref:Alpha-amylase n=1 Tax=Caldanaerobacter subterraneus TaxID=911092 RepID=A0A7Y2L7D5_9THEO|nr:alpha-amylase family glycosyl hydrolase [Caldanaerobacter subterraneus]NNG67037.1 glycosidase [Caldanaerobacter subterraneus]
MRKNFKAFVALFVAILLFFSGCSSKQEAKAPKSEVIYQVMVDRFYNGDPSNDDPEVSKGMFDPTHTNWRMYWGGDLKGLTEKIPYIKGMGVTAIWISPVVDNINKLAVYNGEINAPYHGYWARDFKRVEEHFGTWEDFDNFVKVAHENGIKVILDFAPNHTSPADEENPDFAENGALYDDGKLLGTYSNDSLKLFHHNGSISNWNNLKELQDKNLFDLADLDQSNPIVDKYLKDSIKLWFNHEIDGVRLDAAKHMPMEWVKSFANTIYSIKKDVLLFGEWMLSGPTDPLYGYNIQFANTTGFSVLDFMLNGAIRDVFGKGYGFERLNDTLEDTNKDYENPYKLVTFIDNHDMPRFLSLNNDKDKLHEAIAFIMTTRGIPVIYYGTEQYLHNDTNGGNDPYNRPMMEKFDESTKAYTLIKELSRLRQLTPALQYGTTTARYISDDVYIYERQYGKDVVLVAINKGEKTTVKAVKTSLRKGIYKDYLKGLLKGVELKVTKGNGENLVQGLALPGDSVSVWTNVRVK